MMESNRLLRCSGALHQRARLLCLLAFLTLASTAPRAFSDDAALNDGAYGPAPVGGFKGDESVIRMVSEQIDVTFGKKMSTVDAKFVFRSTKAKEPARQLVGFPDLGAALDEAKRRDPKAQASWFPQEGPTGTIQNMRTFVNGAEVKSELKYGFVDWDDEAGLKPATEKTGTLMAWYVVWVTFPPDQDVVIERKYRVPDGEAVFGINMFDYITTTGATWKQPIGHLEANVTLTDGLTVKDLAWKGAANLPETQKSGPYSGPDKKEWQIVSPTRLKLVWGSFSPGREKNRRGFNLVTIATQKRMDSN